MAGLRGKSTTQVDCHIDVTEDDGLIIIPYKIPDDWTEAPGISSYKCLDRNIVFPGERVQLLLCLSANKHNEGTTAAHKNEIQQTPHKQDGKFVGESNPFLQAEDAYTLEEKNQSGDAKGKIDLKKDVSEGESILRTIDHKRQTDQLHIFKNSHFFARIAESNEPLWSERSAQSAYIKSSITSTEKVTGDSLETAKTVKKKNPISVVIDRGKFDSSTSGGVARGAAQCCSLPNGDIVVLLEVKVGVEFMKDPVFEILQFEKYHERNKLLENKQITSFNNDPCGELLNWLLPLNNYRRPLTRSLSPTLNSSSSIQGSSRVSVSSGSELLSFGRVKSYSLSSISPYTGPSHAIKTPSPTPGYVPEDQYQFLFNDFVEGGNNEDLGPLSFHGVSLVPGRFAVQCGLEGVFTPGRRWRRKFELIQPLEIQSISNDCNTDDLLCVNVKNVSPDTAPNVVVFIDSLTIVSDEVLTSGSPLSLPIACTEVGDNYSLPNLALRRGEEHSFILRPAKSLWKHSNSLANSNLPPRRSAARTARTNRRPSSSYVERRHSEPPVLQYAVLIRCRCNYTESQLIFKHPTSWRPRTSRDLMISVASEISGRALASDGTQIPVQVVTLQASNMTSDDLTLTVREIYDQHIPSSDTVEKSNPSCTHLWLQSRIPLGCVPTQSTTTAKLKLLPLTDGLLNLGSLQIDVKEKGVSYVPKHVLKINASRELPLL